MVADSQPDAIAPRLALAGYYLATARVAEGTSLLEAISAKPGGFAPATSRLADYEFRTGKRPPRTRAWTG